MDTYENNIPQEENQPYDAEELEPQVEPALQEIHAEALVQELPSGLRRFRRGGAEASCFLSA